MAIRKPYGKHDPVRLNTGSESHVQQASKDETDINWIMHKYQKTGVLSWTSKYAPRYGDFEGPQDYLAAMAVVAEAQQSFAELPSKVRKHFGNDPVQLLAALEDPERREELAGLGLLNPIEVQVAEPLPSGEENGGEASPGVTE